MADRPHRRATIEDISARAGVTKSTVSKVLNRRTGFSPDTQARVEQAVAELGYVPITRERGSRATGAVVAIFDTMFSLYSLKILEGIAAGAQIAGVDLITQVLDPRSDGRAQLGLDARRIKTMADKGHSGVLMVTSVITPATAGLFEDYALPLVAIDAQTSLQKSVLSVGSNHWGGGMQAGQHLVDLGHRRIAYVGGSKNNPGLRERFAGFREILDGEGIELDPSLVSEEGMGTAHDAVARMLRAGDAPTAIFASNDADALGAVRAIHEAGLRVPEDVSVVGYDDTYAAVVPSPNLTSVHAPLQAIGHLATTTLLALGAGEHPVSNRLELATELIVRDSTRAIR